MSEGQNYTRGCIAIDQTNKDHVVNKCICSYKLNVFDWLSEVPAAGDQPTIVEVRFKNTRKGFYQNVNSLNLKTGDIVAVEANPGHDIGIISLTGELVLKQIQKVKISSLTDLPKIYRKAKQADIDKWKEAIELEETTKQKAREVALQLKLNMKIGDVEYYGDKTKAIFYYIADERIDFREMIKMLAEQLKVRIEMRQIGSRQEAGRLGGIGPCGRELCCSSFITSFISVTTNAAKIQELSLNPLKLAGQCAKLKCCLNYEVDLYAEAMKEFPETSFVIETKAGKAYHVKNDIFRKVMWYSFDKDSLVNLTPVDILRARELIQLNRKGIIPDDLGATVTGERENKKIDFENVVGQDDLHRFDSRDKRAKRNKKFKNKNKKPANNV